MHTESPPQHSLSAENADLRARLAEAAEMLRALRDNGAAGRRHEAEAPLRQNAELFATLIEQAPADVYVVDSQFRIAQVNAAALPVFAMVQPLVGRDFAEAMEILWGPELSGEIVGIFRHTLETGERYLSPRFSEMRHDLGVEQIFEWETQRVILPDGEHGVVCYFKEITERARAEAALLESAELRAKAAALAEQNAEVERARRALEEKAAELALTSKYKSEFLANMSHELRTPLNSILIFSQQLAANSAGNLTEKQLEFSRHIYSSGTELLHLIDDILDLSKIESGTVSLQIEKIPFAAIHEILDRNFRHAAEAKKLPLGIRFAVDLPGDIVTDRRRLQQILANLLSNAVKFTSQGYIEVRAGFATEGWNPDHPVIGKAAKVVAFSVKDTGIGIAPEKQRLIFEAFQQADAGTSRKYGGTGLGLAISRELAALLGGEIRLASVPGEGSTFTLYLPLHYTRPEHVRPGPVASHGEFDGSNEILRGRTILAVDDDARNIFALSSLLENQGMEVLCATDGRSAIEIIRNSPELSLVLLDVMMPSMDGYETLREIRKVAEFRTLPILALTAKAMKGDRERCLDAGASDYIAKPVNTGQLLTVLRKWISR